MITNYGLEAQKTTNPLLSGSIYAFGFNQVAVGTGNNAPAATDTSLQTEVARLNTTHGTDSTVVESVANSYTQIKTTLARKATFSASYSLKEFGFFSSSATNTCMYRQLFRQDQNNNSSTPITIQVYAYDTLIITYTVIWRIDVSSTVNVGYTSGTFTHPSGNGTVTLYPVAADSQTIATLLALFHPYPTLTNTVGYIASSNDISSLVNISNADRTQYIYKEFSTSNASYGSVTNQSVVKTAGAAGNYSTTLKAVFGTSVVPSGNVYALLVGIQNSFIDTYDAPNGGVMSVWQVEFYAGVWAVITPKIKTSTQTWTLEWTLSWAAI